MSSFLDSIKTSYVLKRENNFDSLDKKYFWLIIISWFKIEPNKIIRAICIWTQRLAKLDDNRFSSLLNPYMYRLNAWLSLKVYGSLPTHICLAELKVVRSSSSPNL